MSPSLPHSPARMVAGQRKRSLSPRRRKLYKDHKPPHLGDFKHIWACIGLDDDPKQDHPVESAPEPTPDSLALVLHQPSLGDGLAHLAAETLHPRDILQHPRDILSHTRDIHQHPGDTLSHPGDAPSHLRDTLPHPVSNESHSPASGHTEDPYECDTCVSNDGESPNVFSPQLNPASSPEPEVPPSPALGLPGSVVATKFTHHGSHVAHQSFTLSSAACAPAIEDRAAAFAQRMNHPFASPRPKSDKSSLDDLRRLVLEDFRVHDAESAARFATQYANGIYVYIDWSNIMIGCQEELKRAQGLPPTSRRTEFLDFSRIKLILERDRAIKSRVLAGSRSANPGQKELKSLDAFAEHGYDASILERVFRPNELAQARPGYGPPLETSPRKMQEQGVDEILQMKISDDLIDGVIAAAPGVVVLATGDGNEAQFSRGFFAKVEQALRSGWIVELYAFKKNTSATFRDRKFQAAWDGRFTLHFLDKFAEALVDES